MTRYGWVLDRKAEGLGFPITMACKVAWVSRQALWDWRAKVAAGPAGAEAAEAALVLRGGDTRYPRRSDATYGMTWGRSWNRRAKSSSMVGSSKRRKSICDGWPLGPRWASSCARKRGSTRTGRRSLTVRMLRLSRCWRGGCARWPGPVRGRLRAPGRGR